MTSAANALRVSHEIDLHVPDSLYVILHKADATSRRIVIMSSTELQALLRFLSQDAKVPLATAISKVSELRKAQLDSVDKLSKAKADEIKPIFTDEKVCKQVIAAAKRAAKKRAAGDDGGRSSSQGSKKRKGPQLFSSSEDEVDSPARLENSVALPTSDWTENDLAETTLFTNRAPLVLAFVVTLLKHTMPEQPLSSRLSLAQAYVSITSRSRAVNLGIESGKSAEEEGFGEGQPVVKIMGKDIRVLRRWGYDWETETKPTSVPSTEVGEQDIDQPLVKAEIDVNETPALWALDLEALKKSEMTGVHASAKLGNHSNMPIYTPQSARSYLLKSFDTPPDQVAEKGKRPSAAVKATEKESNLGKLLRALDMLYESWVETMKPEELDSKTWSWYVKVRPEVDNGVAGWGGKNRLKLEDILALRRAT